MYLDNYFERGKKDFAINENYKKIDHLSWAVFRIMSDDPEFAENLERSFNGGSKSRKILADELRKVFDNEAMAYLSDLYRIMKDMARKDEVNRLSDIKKADEINIPSERIIMFANDNLTDEDMIRIYKQGKFLLMFYNGLARNNRK